MTIADRTRLSRVYALSEAADAEICWYQPKIGLEKSIKYQPNIISSGTANLWDRHEEKSMRVFSIALHCRSVLRGDPPDDFLKRECGVLARHHSPDQHRHSRMADHQRVIPEPMPVDPAERGLLGASVRALI
jgi:hypothetical protein